MSYGGTGGSISSIPREVESSTGGRKLASTLNIIREKHMMRQYEYYMALYCLLLFLVVLSKEFREGVPSELLYADNLALNGILPVEVKKRSYV